MSLDKELEGVTAPEVESPDDLTDEATFAPAEEAAAGTETPAKDERPAENVRREVLRKHDELKAEVLGLRDLVTQLVSAKTAPASPQTLDDMSVDQLRDLKLKIPDERKAEFDAYYQERVIDDRLNTKLTKHAETERQAQARKRANQVAVDRYPQLLDRASAFRAEVNRRMATLDPNYIRYNERIVLNIAEDVASEQGLSPRTVKGSRSFGQPGSTRRSEAPVKDGSVQGTMSDAEYEKIASKLKHAKKGGFDKTRIMARNKEYQDFNQGEK